MVCSQCLNHSPSRSPWSSLGPEAVLINREEGGYGEREDEATGTEVIPLVVGSGVEEEDAVGGLAS